MLASPDTLQTTKSPRSSSSSSMASRKHDRASAIDPTGGFCTETRTFHSLRPPAPLPPATTPLSVADYVLSHLRVSQPHPSTAALIDASTGRRILYPDFTRRIGSLATSLQTSIGISAGDTAFVLSPNSINIPILYYSLLSLGAAISPANPASSVSDISRQIQLCKPVVAFATSETAAKIPSLPNGVVLLDSPEFESMMTTTSEVIEFRRVEVSQSDTATILYSSGTTGRVKGVELTHRNWISVLAGAYAVRGGQAKAPQALALCAVPYFHVYGFGYCTRALALGETLVTMGTGRFDLRQMMRTIEELRVSHVAVAPPIVVAMVKDWSVMDGCDLSSLEVIGCGGAPLRRSVVEQLRKRLPNVQLAQSYGLTESTGRVFATVGLKESLVKGATGKLMSNFQAKIVDPETGTALPPSVPGELYLKGPCIMKGYVGEKEETAAILDSDGWLRTGDLCYIDNEGYLFIVDRIKELIKYKGYQVAPAELEHMLHSRPDITDAAVVPYPDEEAGQVPMAFVVKRTGSIVNESEITDFIAKQVAPYKKIRKLKFIDAIPKNAQGKVLRRELIKLALSNPASKL